MFYNHATYILNPDINPIELWDSLCDRLCKADALAQFSLTEGISEHLDHQLKNYLWALSQLIHEAWEINQALCSLDRGGE